jgi:hypothetical protein
LLPALRFGLISDVAGVRFTGRDKASGTAAPHLLRSDRLGRTGAGVAPGAKPLAVRAFGIDEKGAQGRIPVWELFTLELERKEG